MWSSMDNIMEAISGNPIGKMVPLVRSVKIRKRFCEYVTTYAGVSKKCNRLFYGKTTAKYCIEHRK